MSASFQLWMLLHGRIPPNYSKHQPHVMETASDLAQCGIEAAACWVIPAKSPAPAPCIACWQVCSCLGCAPVVPAVGSEAAVGTNVPLPMSHLPRARIRSSSDALGSSLLTHSVIQREYANLYHTSGAGRQQRMQEVAIAAVGPLITRHTQCLSLLTY